MKPSLPTKVIGWVLGALVLGLSLSALLAWQQGQHNQRNAQAVFVKTAEQVAAQLSMRMRLYEYGVRGARGAALVVGEQTISRSLFRKYAESRDIDKEFPGARGFGLIRRVPADKQAQFLVQARSDGKPDFAIRDFSPHEGERFVIQYIEPVERNQAAVGLDIGSEANRRQAAIAAMRSGQATITGPITLVQAVGGRQKSVLFLLPIYRDGMARATPEQRETAAWGWSYAPLSLKEVLADFRALDDDVWLVLRDTTNPQHPDEFYNSASTESATATGMKRVIDLDVYGRRWQVELNATPHFAQRLDPLQPHTVFLMGTAITLISAALIGAMRLGREREQRAALQKAQLATIVEHSADAIIGESMDGLIMSWNQAATQLFGHSASQVIGKPLASILLPPQRQHEDATLLEEIAKGNALAAFDTTRRHQDGTSLDVSITAGPIRSPDGRVIGMAKLIRDIRDRKAADQQRQDFTLTLERQVHARTAELETARRDLQTVLDAVPSMIGYWDKNLRNRVANQAYSRWFGVPPSALVGKHLRDLLGKDLLERNLPYIEGALRGEPQQFERDIPRPDGQGSRHALTNYLPDIVDGQVQGFYVVVHDITEITEGRITLAKERERLGNIIEGTHVGTWEWNVQTGEAHFNERWADIIGYQLEELAPVSIQTWLSHAHPDDLARSEALLKSHFSGELDYYACESRMRHKNGDCVWVLDRGRVFTRTADGQPEWMYGTHQDITVTKNAQSEVTRFAALLDSVLRSATELSIIATDTNGLITIFNRGAEHMLGYHADDMVGKSTPALLHLADEVMTRGQELSAQHGTPIEGFRVFIHQPELDGAETREWTYVRKDGSHLRVSLAVTAIQTVDGQLSGYLGIAQDITERSRTDAALRQAKTAAEEANAAKSMFLANMSHEIRTPMNAVIGVAHLLSTTKLDEDQRQLLANLQVAGRSLLGIINDVLDLAKIEAGEMGVELATFDPNQLLGDLTALFTSGAYDKGITFEVLGADHLPGLLEGDELRLRQILVNLASNAIKFTQHGGVAVQVEQQRMDGHTLWLRWSVRDSGLGIAPQALETLFDPFTQADASTTRRFGGTGLGLSIVKRLAEMLGGSIGVTSTLGRGSEFWVDLPFTIADEHQHLQAKHGSSGLDVVVVDDRADDRRVLSGMCRAFGWRSIELASGQALIDHLRDAIAEGKALPDALLVDWQMPQLDGLQALTVLAGQLTPHRLPAALIISAHEREAIHAMDVHQVADHILCKPVEASELFNAVNSSVARHTGNTDRVMQSTSMDGVDAEWLTGLKILLVDDSTINLDVARRLLEREGAIVQTCLNGAQALEHLRAAPTHFDAVLMDVQMPEMDGYEATRRLRNELGLRQLPVLALTAGALGEERRKAHEAGMDEFLTKPLDPANLVRTLRRCVERARGQPLKLMASTKRAGAPHHWPEIEGIDSKGAAHRLSNDSSLFLAMLDRLLHEFDSGTLLALPIPEQATERQALAARMHNLRGSAGLLGAQKIYQLAGAIEASMGSQAPAPDVGASMAALCVALQALAVSAQAALAEHRHKEVHHDAPPDAAQSLEPQDLERLVTMLKQQDLAALEHFQRIAPALLTLWGTTVVGPLRQSIESFDFASALVLLNTARDSKD
ncbi:PAS domain S-box protein [Aquabacterium sp.]|uniref:CHASE domain-containing hybrid sensor histidine kinase/response regulator n=1 Tax=Aquabacterium sp. TaxID=1872578 RepID=UPI00248A3C1B|nr:PAS domain S-box protein [Aquabacterium sp.]MDI1257802.1 PAS domain S-box protein [Aquabacterium sp.]